MDLIVFGIAVSESPALQCHEALEIGLENNVG